MDKRKSPSRLQNLSFAMLAGQAGCITMVIIFAALLAGLWLDSRFGVRGPFTVGLLLASVPVSLVAMVWLARSMINQIRPGPREEDSSNTEEVDR
jgi:hypothetical protein